MLCDFAKTFPSFVGNLLDREAGLNRRFREESVTDMWVASLVSLRAYGVFVDLAIEADTGADLEIWFLSKRLDRGLGFVIQAKRAKCNRGSAPPHSCLIANWRNHRFPELDHRGGAGRIKGSQARDLVQASWRTGRPVYPLYAFYVPEHVHHSSGFVEGVMVADGHEVRRRIVQGLWNTRKRAAASRCSPATFKRLDELDDLLVPLETMFCISPWLSLADVISEKELIELMVLRFTARHVGVMNLPGPHAVAESMGKAIRGRRGDLHDLPLPEVTREIPADIRQLVRGEATRRAGRDLRRDLSGRSRLVFVATRNEGEEA